MKSPMKNSFYGAIGFVFPAIISLATTPYILHKLTVEVYGIYLLAISLVGLMSFLDLGFGQGIIKFVSEYEAREDFEKINKILAVSLTIYTIMGLIGASIIYFFSDFLVLRVFKLSENNLAMGSLAFKIVAFGFLFSFLNGLFSSIPKGLQRYDIAIKIQNFIWFSSVMTTMLLLYIGKGLVDVLIAYLIFQFIGMLSYAYVSKKLIPSLKFTFGFDRTVFKEIFGFSIFVGLNVISGNIVTRLDKMIVSYFLGTSAVSFYTIPYNLSSMIGSFVGSVNQFLFPAISGLSARGEENKIRHYFLKSLDYTALISALLIIPFIIFSDRFIVLWLGKDFAEKSYHLAPIIAFAFFFSCLTSVSLWFYTALNKTHINLVSSLIGSSSYLIISLMLIPTYGLKGAAISFMFILLPFPAYNFYICKIIEMQFSKYVLKILPYSLLTLISLTYIIFWNGRDFFSDSLISVVLLLIMILLKKKLILELLNKIYVMRLRHVL